MIEEKDGLCGICPAGCWVRATLENGQLRQVERFAIRPPRV